jgi:hypothetical protein
MSWVRTKIYKSHDWFLCSSKPKSNISLVLQGGTKQKKKKKSVTKLHQIDHIILIT